MTKIVASQDGFPTVQDMRRRLVENYAEAPYGTPISYRDLLVMLERDCRTDRRARAAILQARTELLTKHQRLLWNEPRVGYRIAQPADNREYSKRKRSAAGRRLFQGLLAMTHTAYELLSEKEQNAAREEMMRVLVSRTMLRRVSRMKALPNRETLALPSGQALLKILTKKKA